MNKKFLLLAPLAPLALFGLNEPSEVGAQPACTEMRIVEPCQPGSRVTINTQTKNIAPPNICAAPESSVYFNVEPRGTAEVVSKNGTSWLSGSGTGFTVNVPSDASGYYEYNVYFEDGTCIDPRISIDE